MRGKLIASACILLFAMALAPKPASAQVMSVVDEHGHRVYINLEPVAPKAVLRNVSAKSAPAASDNNVSLASRAKQSETNAENSSGTLTNDRLEELIKTVSERHHVDPALVRAVIHTESNGNPAAVSNKGAQGLMQLMPTTALQLGVANVFNPQDNIEGGVKYLQQQLTRYNGDLDKALAAYNAGPGAVDRAGGVPKYKQTQEYVRKVTNSYLQGAPAHSGGKESAASINASVSRPMYQTVDSDGHIVWVNN
jgi:soluble lytic murein transglycosylase-like protein